MKPTKKSFTPLKKQTKANLRSLLTMLSIYKCIYRIKRSDFTITINANVQASDKVEARKKGILKFESLLKENYILNAFTQLMEEQKNKLNIS